MFNDISLYCMWIVVFILEIRVNDLTKKFDQTSRERDRYDVINYILIGMMFTILILTIILRILGVY